MPAATTHVEMAKDVLRTSPEIAKLVKNRQMLKSYQKKEPV